MTQPHFSAQLLFPGDTTSISFARLFFNSIARLWPSALPGSFGNSEPLELEANSRGVDESMLQEGWMRNELFIWKPQAAHCEAMFSIKDGTCHSAFSMYGEALRVDVGKVAELFAAIAREMQVDVGYLHIVTVPEVVSLRSCYQDAVAPFNSGLHTRELRRWMPNLACGTYFGRPYVELIGLERLLNTPAALVAPWGEGVYIQLQADICDVIRDYPRFEMQRAVAKGHLGEDLFYSEGDSTPRRAAVFPGVV